MLVVRQEPSEVLLKTRYTVRFGRDVEEGLNTLGLTFEPQTLFLELVQTNTEGEVSQKIPCFMPSHAAFFLNTTETHQTLSIATAFGPCRLSFDRNANVIIHEIPAHMHFNLETFSTIFIEEKSSSEEKSEKNFASVLKFKSKAIQNHGDLLADTLSFSMDDMHNHSLAKMIANQLLEIDLSGTLKNQGIIRSHQDCQLKTLGVLENHPGALLGADSVLTLKEISHLINEGMLYGRKSIETLNPMLFENAATGTLSTDETAFLVLSDRSSNTGNFFVKKLVLSGESFSNKAAAKIFATVELNVILNQCFDNSGVIKSFGKTTLKSKRIIQAFKEGVIESDQSLSLLADGEIENSGQLVSKQDVFLVFNHMKNEKTGEIKSQTLNIHVEKYLKNKGFIAATESMRVTAPSSRNINELHHPEPPKNSLINEGEIFIGKNGFFFEGKKIINKLGTLKAQGDMTFKAIDIDLMEEVVSDGDIHIYSGAGQWVVSDKVIALKELVFYFIEGREIKEARQVQGSLKYVLLESAQKPLFFLANQSAPQGTLSIQTKTPCSVGNDSLFITLSAGVDLIVNSHQFQLFNGRLVALNLQLASNTDMILGTKNNTSGLGAIENVYLRAEENIVIDHLELKSGLNLDIMTKTLDVVSSHLEVAGDAKISVQSKAVYRLLTEYKANGHRAALNDWPAAFESYKVIGPSETALTNSTHFKVGGRLTLMGSSEIFGSQIICGAFSGDMPQEKSFVPYTSERKAYLCGHKKAKNAHWEFNPSAHGFNTLAQTPLMAKLSIAGEVNTTNPVISLDGIVSALSLSLRGIKEGLIGKPLIFTLKLPPAKPFNTRLSLIDYQIPSTVLYEITENGVGSIYQPIIPFHFNGFLGPVFVLDKTGVLRPNIHRLRCLFSPLQEQELLTKALMSAVDRGFLSKALKTTEEMLAFLKNNAANMPKDGTFPEPVLIYEEIEFRHQSGRVEMVLIPILHLPKSLDNPRSRDWAGGIFSLGDIRIEGASLHSTLKITGHLASNGEIILRSFKQIDHVSRTIIQTHEFTTHQTTRNFGGFVKKHRKTKETITTTEVEPGNTVTAEGLLYESVDNLQFEGAEMSLGSQGLKTNEVNSIEEKVLISQSLMSYTDKKKTLLGNITTSGTTVSNTLNPTRIVSEGPVELHSNEGQYDAIQITAPSIDIKAVHLSFHEFLKQLEVARINDEKTKESNKKRNKRHQRRALIKMITGTVVGMMFAPMAAQRLLLQLGTLNAIFLTEGALAVTTGMVFGGISATVQNKSPLKSILQSGLFSAVNCAVSDLLSSVEKLSQLEALKNALEVTAIASLETALNGGHLLENVMTSVAADFVATEIATRFNIPMPASFRLENRKLIQQRIQKIAHRLIRSTTVSILTHSESLGHNLAASGLGSLAEDLGENLNNQLSKRVDALPKPASITKPKQSKTKSQITTEKASNDSWPNLAIRALKGEHSAEIAAFQQENRRLVPPGLVAASDALEDVQNDLKKLLKPLELPTRAAGLVQSVGGMAQMIFSVGAGVITTPTVIGPAVATMVGTMGADNLVTGFKAMLTGTPSSTLLFKATAALGEKTGLYSGTGASYIELGANLLGPFGLHPKAVLFSSHLRSPMTLSILEPGSVKLYTGLPIDIVKLQKPWVTTKDFLTKRARLYPEPLSTKEERIIEYWTGERIQLLDTWKHEKIATVVNPKISELIAKTEHQLEYHMTPNDLAALLKEQRGVKIYRPDGKPYDHFNNEWRAAKKSFSNAFKGGWSNKLGEKEALNKRFRELSRMQQRFEDLIRRGLWESEKKTLKN